VLAQHDVWPDRIRPLRRVEYESLVDRGLLDDSRVELLLGVLVDMTPQGPFHADVVAKLAAQLVRALPDSVEVRVQSPLALSDDSEPEPDIAVVAAGDYRSAHPAQALLVVEVADTSLPKDRGVKTGLYAAAAVPEFWLVNLTDRLVEVHRRPAAGRYTELHRVEAGGQLVPAGFPRVSVPVADLLE